MKTVPVLLLPEQIGALLARLPAYPGSVLLVAVLNRTLVPNLPADVRAILARRAMRIHVRDARLTFDFSCDGDRFVACAGGKVADLTISASAQKAADATGNRAAGSNAAVPGRITIRTPAKPTSTAIQRRMPTFSPSRGIDRAVVNIGDTNPIAEASARGSCARPLTKHTVEP